MNRYVVGLVMAVVLPCAAQAQTPPVAAFARLPAVTQAAISPNGQHIAILGGRALERAVFFNTIDQPGVRTVAFGDVETVGLLWAGDDYAIARVGVYGKVGPRADVRVIRNAVLSREGKHLSFLLGSDQLSTQLVNHTIQRVVRGPQPKVIVTGLSEAAGPSAQFDTRLARKGEDGDMRVLALYATDPVTGRGSMTERGDFDIVDWEVDLSGEARVQHKIDQITRKTKMFARAKGESRWRLIQDGADGREFLGYSDAADSVYFSTKTAEGLRVERLKLADGSVEQIGKPVTDGDVELLWDNYTNSVVGIRALGGQTSIEWLDPAFGSAYGTLSRAFKGKIVTLRSWSEDRTRLLATAEGADSPATWYLYDRTRKEISPIGEEYPELKSASLGSTTMIRYKARDGLEIPAYLTLPSGASATAKAPLVVMPHGGPKARDGDGFDYMVQFLATRGYAVLRPQFRGSTGFGPSFENAGNGEYGRKMQTDIIDGVGALASNSVIDATRACVVGASFGGYSALWAAVFEPKAYRCAASIAGVADLGMLINEKGTDFGQTSRTYQLLRDELRAAAPEGLPQISPLRNASRASIPILLLHGEQDTVVGPMHSREMNEALRAAGKPVEYVEIAGENHYLSKTQSRVIVLEKLEAFLGQHLGVPGAQAATPADR